jgi:hypothetical protein
VPDLSDLLRKSATAKAASYEPSAELPQRVARRTLQLQRRRRVRIVGAAFGALLLAVPVLVNRTGSDSNAVSVAYGPAPATAEKPDVTTTTTTVALQLLDLQAFIDNGVKQRTEALRKLMAAAAKQQRARDRVRRGGNGETLAAAAANEPAPTQNGPSDATTATTRAPTTATTGQPATTTTTTTTTTLPPVRVPLAIIAPDHVCAGVPAVFRATGTGVENVVWSNLAIGPTAIYVLTTPTTVVARLDLDGSVSSQAVAVQVTPVGTPPC